MQDVYVTSEPLEAFHARVAFCLDLHNEAVKALRYDVSVTHTLSVVLATYTPTHTHMRRVIARDTGTQRVLVL